MVLTRSLKRSRGNWYAHEESTTQIFIRGLWPELAIGPGLSLPFGRWFICVGRAAGALIVQGARGASIGMRAGRAPDASISMSVGRAPGA